VSSTAGARATARVPWCTLGVVALALAASFTPGAPALLEYERSRIAHGELWRLLSAHLVDAWPGLAIVDLPVLVVLGSWLELRVGARAFVAMLASAIAASAAVWFARPDLELYQGSSAIGYGVFAALTVNLVRDERHTFVRIAAGAALALLTIKTGGELAGLWSSAIAPLPSGVEAVAIAHAAGGLAGGCVELAWTRGAQRLQRASTSRTSASRSPGFPDAETTASGAAKPHSTSHASTGEAP
jgi:membrane associated rhomboid family serine protease